MSIVLGLSLDTQHGRKGAKVTALYRQLADKIREKIDSGAYPSGSTLPTIVDLAREAGVSKATASKAIDLLSKQGHVRPIPHTGTVVLDTTPVRIPLSRYRHVQGPSPRGPWETACAQAGRDGRMVTVEVATEPAQVAVAEALGIEAGAQVIRRSRCALLDDVPAQLQTSYLPHDLFQDTPLAGEGKVVGGVYAAMRQAGVVPATADETITVRAATRDEVTELGLRGVPWVQIVERVTQAAGGRVLEYLEIVSDPARVQLVYNDLPLTPA